MSAFAVSIARRGRSNRGTVNRVMVMGNSNPIGNSTEDTNDMAKPRLIKPRILEERETTSLKEESEMAGEDLQNHHSDQVQLQDSLDDSSRELHSFRPQRDMNNVEKSRRNLKHERDKASLAFPTNVFDERNHEPIMLTQGSKKLEHNKSGETTSSMEKLGGYRLQIREENALKQMLISDIKTSSDECSAGNVKLINHGLGTHENIFADSSTESQNHPRPEFYHTQLTQASESILAALHAAREESASLRRIIADKDSQIKTLTKGKSKFSLLT
ncbi:unnamed protein product [Allacma fusca]|uniref:Uncharacterized protein n=1 Tax=Allacma fusca TaxID=39272 RepID=A0A8J2P5I4_9HEXA|nr:unnamed protein product [Allacma fusca]